MMYKYKKVISVFLICAVAFISFATASFATENENICMKFNKTEDDTLIASVFVNNLLRLEAIDFSLKINRTSYGEFIDITTENTDSDLYVSDFDSSDTCDIEKPSFIFSHSMLVDSINFSGFFTSSFTSADDFHLCDITIKISPEFSENLILNFYYTLTSDSYKTNKASYISINTENEEPLWSAESVQHSLPFFMGDVNKDGSVTASDARVILRASVNLESLSLNSVPYADFDYDGKITASDARTVLRTSVNLEEYVSHSFSVFADEGITCDKGGNFTFICTQTGKTFSMQVGPAEHILISSSCETKGICTICRTVVNDEAFHNFDENGFCSDCFADKDKLSDINEAVKAKLDEIYTYNQLTEEALAAADYYEFLSDAQATAKCIRNAVDITAKEPGAEYANFLLSSAYRLVFDSFTACMNDEGEIPATKENCKEIASSLQNAMKFISAVNTDNQL